MLSLSKLWDVVKDKGADVQRISKFWTQLSNWTTMITLQLGGKNLSNLEAIGQELINKGFIGENIEN